MKLIRYQYPPLSTLSTLSDWLVGQSSTINACRSNLSPLDTRSAQVAVDLFEDSESYYARFEFPGVARELIDLQVEDSTLQLSLVEEQGVGSESSSVAAKRSLALPDDVDQERISAKLQDGVLTISLPKSVAQKPRQIEIN